MATFDEIARRVRTDGQEGPGTPAARDLAERMQDDIIDVVDDIASRTDCYAPQFLTDLVADQDTYCAPNYYKNKAVLVKDSSGNWNSVFVDGIDGADRYTRGQWRNDTSVDPPLYAFFRGQNKYVLDPTPSTSRTAALLFEGFAKPGTIWKYDSTTGAAITLAGSHECPLPTFAQDQNIIVDGVLVIRLRRYARAEKDASMRVLMLQESDRREVAYQRKLGQVEAHAAQYWERSAFAGVEARCNGRLGSRFY